MPGCVIKCQPFAGTQLGKALKFQVKCKIEMCVCVYVCKQLNMPRIQVCISKAVTSIPPGTDLCFRLQ